MEDLFTYLRIAAKGHWRKILFSSNPYIALVISIFLIVQPVETIILPYRIGQITDFSTDYNLVILGFSVTGLALVVAIPSITFSKFLSEKNNLGQSPYRDLIFIFSWTSLLHFLSFIISVFFMFFNEGEFVFIYHNNVSLLLLFSWFYVFVQIYSVIQLSSLMFAIIFVADLYAKFIADRS